MKRILLDAAPADGNGGNTQPANQPAAPASPKIVKNTPVKSPNEIRLEKEVAGLRDEVDGLKGWQNEVNSALEGLQVGAPPKPAPVKVKPGTVPAPTPSPTPQPEAPNGFFAQVDRDIWGAPKQG